MKKILLNFWFSYIFLNFSISYSKFLFFILMDLYLSFFYNFSIAFPLIHKEGLEILSRLIFLCLIGVLGLSFTSISFLS